MFKFFRRGKSDNCERSAGNANNNKKSHSQENVENSRVSTTLENSLSSRGKSSLNTMPVMNACAASEVIDKNKLVASRRQDDQHDHPHKKEHSNPGGKFGPLKKWSASSVPNYKDDDQIVENVKNTHAREISSRNEFVDLSGGDRTTTTPCRKQNDRSKFKLADKKNASIFTAATHDDSQVHLLHSQNKCWNKQQNQKQQQQDQSSANRFEQPPNAHTSSFNPINKSREFFYEIMGKNRSRNRNRNRNKDTKPYNRFLIIDNVLTAERDAENIGDCFDQQNKTNEIVVPAQKQEQFMHTVSIPFECNGMPNGFDEFKKNSEGDIRSGEIISSDDNEQRELSRSESIDEFPKENQTENDEDFENFGYQITKSKNKTNLLIKYESEEQHDHGVEKAEEYSTREDCLQPCGGDQDEVMGHAEAHDNERTNDCADASCDAKCIESENNLFSGNPESHQGIYNCNNNSSRSNSITEIVVVDEETRHENDSNVSLGLGIKQAEHLEEASPQHQILDDFHRIEDQPQQIEQNNAIATATSVEDGDDNHNDGPVEGGWYSQKNFDETRNRIDAQAKFDQDDLLEEQQLSVPTISKQEIAFDSVLEHLRQDLDESTNMGQDNSKSASADQHKRSSNEHVQSNIVIPTITVADYSVASSKVINKDSAPTKNSDIFVADNEVFYDTETFEIDSASKAYGTKVVNSEKDSNAEFETCHSYDDNIAIEDDFEEDGACGDYYSNNFADIPVTVIHASDLHRDDVDSATVVFHSDTTDDIILSNNSSSSTISIDSKLHDSPDSGIEILDESRNNPSSETIDHLLNINRNSESFARGGSTDCDENFLLQSDNEDHDYYQNQSQSEYFKGDFKKVKPIFIDSISLPDVVVESTTSAAGAMGNSHSVKTVEDNHRSPGIVTDQNDNETRDLVNQEARYSAQLEEAQKIIISTQTKVNELQSKIDSLEKELSIKSWNADRLQGELQAANKEDACVRRRLKLLQDELVDVKQKYSENEYELTRRYDELKTKHHELLDNYRHTQNLANALQTQLTFLQSDIERSREEKQKLSEEKDDEVRKLQEALKESQEKHKELEIKWQKEFEVLRTQNADREDHLMSDCEWKLRTMQRNCKDKVDAAKREKNEALEKASEISTRAAEELEHVAHLLPLEAEIKQLRGLTNDQKESLVSMSEQMTELRRDLESANTQLETEIENVRKIRLHCDNALSDKDRQMIQKIEEARGQVAVEWERRLLEEMTRLKHEVELVHIEERHDALEKLQQEHIEEIKVLTCRYDANEEELRTEITKLRETLQQKCNEFSQLKERTDAALLETRLHLERADSEYQIAINREIEKRDRLEEQLKVEYQNEKSEMEEKFRERLNQVKDEFARELVTSTDDMNQKHRKQLEQQWEKLVAEKEEALQSMESRHRIRMEEAGNRIKEIEIQHQRQMKEMKTNFEIERKTLETRDLQNSQEIEQLHRKCRCLTNLFEEMRMRYERREPRPDDLREIAELRERCESQERDLHALTERLREIQMEKEDRENSIAVQRGKSKATHRKPPSKIIQTNCDVIYEENEERVSPHKETSGLIEEIQDDEEDSEDDDDEEVRNENRAIRNGDDATQTDHDTTVILVES